MKREQDCEIKFWKDWLKADSIKRLELVKRLPLFDMSLKIKNRKLWKHSFAGLINSYFEDLESAIYVKIHKEENKKHKNNK